MGDGMTEEWSGLGKGTGVTEWWSCWSREGVECLEEGVVTEEWSELQWSGRVKEDGMSEEWSGWWWCCGCKGEWSDQGGVAGRWSGHVP